MATDYTHLMVEAVWRALDAALACKVYHGKVPDDAVLPYVSVPDVLATPRDAASAERRTEVIITLSVYSASRGRGEASGILAQMEDVLHRARPPLDSGRVIKAFVIRSRVTADAGEETFMGRMTVRATIEHQS